VEHALQRYDIIAGIRRKGPRVAETRGLIIRSKGIYEVEIYDGISLGRFAERIGFDSPKKQQNLFELISKKRASHSNFIRVGYGLIAAAVVDVSEEPSSVVYDLTVEDVHSFVANGFIVHNTAAVVKEKSGLMMLEAGAVVLADQGVACLHPDTNVIVNDTVRRVSDLFNERIAESIRYDGKSAEAHPVNFDVVSFADDLTVASRAATVLRRRKYSGEMVRMKLASGFEISLTPDHKLVDGRSLIWQESGEFKEGDLVLAPLRLPAPDSALYLLDVVPESFKVRLTDDQLAEIESIAAASPGLSDALQRHVEVGKFRKILQKAGLYDTWRDRPYTFEKPGAHMGTTFA
jgi:replicative DNA helicase Mcm